MNDKAQSYSIPAIVSEIQTQADNTLDSEERERLDDWATRLDCAYRLEVSEAGQEQKDTIERLQRELTAARIDSADYDPAAFFSDVPKYLQAEYKLIATDKVSAYLNEGWSLYGSPFYAHSEYSPSSVGLCQAVVRGIDHGR